MKALEKHKLLRITFLFLLCFLFSIASYSQDCSEYELIPGCEGDIDAPLDAGTSILLTLGAIYGAKKIRDSRN
ncbi:PID-CTERM protein-sorting domain-containing protein [Pedobacter sp. SYSU D00535]|uniref:PID-CTERM protein-sorting domain-containing protein n=1 Tax=Pedobacter sp. SYSU D00535 TaxID=2810308 RepID=UPI00351B1ED4